MSDRGAVRGDARAGGTDALARWIGVGVLVPLLWVNGAAGSGALSGESIGVIANDYRSFFLPANYTFGIWSLIYLGVIAFAVFQVTPPARTNETLPSVRRWWLASCVLNAAWIVTFAFRRFGAALLVMVALLLTLITLHEHAVRFRDRLGWLDHAFVVQPFVVYLAWISVALISNTFQYATYADWSGWGVSGEGWAMVMIGVAAALGVFMLLHRRAWAFPLVVAWALFGIADRFEGLSPVATVALAFGVGSIAAPPTFAGYLRWARASS